MGMVRHAEDVEPTEASFRAVIAGIRDGKWKEQVEEVRAAWEAGGKDATDPLKKLLPGGLFSATFTYRSAEKVKDKTGAICADLDHLENVEGTRDLIVSDSHVLACFISPTGTGLKVICRIDPARPHYDSYLAAETYFREQFGLAIDRKCKDINRLCFVSYDPDAFLADTAEVLPYPPLPPAPEPPAEPSQVRRDLPAGFVMPGTEYNTRGDWQALVKKHGWKEDKKPYWTRPGKKSGISASWDVCPGKFHVFTDSAPPLVDEENYSPFDLYVALECGGNKEMAYEQLYEAGYGSRRNGPTRAQQAALDAQNELAVTAPKHQFPGERFLNDGQNGESPKEHAGLPAPVAKATEDQAKKNADLLARCFAAEFNFAIIPPRPIPRFLIKGHQACTGGNLTTITGQAKTAKTGVIDAMIASVIAAHNGNAKDCDCLGFSASPPNGGNVIHFDCEQAVFDHDQVIRRSHRRSRAEIWPAFLRSFCLTGFSIQERRALIPLVLEAMEKRGGIHSLFIDGPADLLAGVNEEEVSNVLVADLQNLAMRYNCPIISVIHENPGQDGGKMRGHLGSQMERKAESNIRLKKIDEVITLFSQKMRHGLIMEKDGPTFKWDFDAAMHMSCPSVISSKVTAKRDKLHDLLTAAFARAGEGLLCYSDLVEAIEKVSRTSQVRSQAIFTEAKKAGFLKSHPLAFWSLLPLQG